ncbi:MAG: hypothetical protein A3K18_16680 [Lentisphaerae bacterium RIFOXYA12_64_32]|nr:MAG: hypothetical protein A3K18_16680 [Lentisphaerae bacterium RIFOXYA12_64_32]
MKYCGLRQARFRVAAGRRLLAGLLAVGLAAVAGARADAPPAESALAWALRLPLIVSDTPDAQDAAVLQLTPAAGSAPLWLEIRRSGLRLLDAARTLADAPTSLTPGSHLLLLRQTGRGLVVCLDHNHVLNAPDVRLPADAAVNFQPGAGIDTEGRVRIQKADRITFADDFAREPGAELLWEVSGGRFALNSTLKPGSSQSAFQLWASVPDASGLAVAANSYWFWADYQAGISVQAPALPVTLGLVVQYVDADAYHLLKWTQPVDGPGKVQLLRHRKTGDTALAEAPLSMRPGQWYRLTAVCCGTRIRAFVNGAEVGAVDDTTLTGGRIGLLLDHTTDAYFDDAQVDSVGAEVLSPQWTPPDPFGPCEQQWSDFAGKRFAADRFMQQWSQPRSFWSPVPKRGSVQEFRSRFFSDVRFSWQRGTAPCAWPARPAEVVLFADAGQPDTGYRLRLAEQRATLTRAGVAAADAAFPDASLDEIEFSAAAGRVTVRLNGRDLIDWADPSPLTSGSALADLGPTSGAPDWRDTVRLSSTHRLDYGFDSAPVAWEAQSGTWCATHRWACVPEWSFFGGRGAPGAPGVTHGNAVLWNRRLFRGDFDLELFLAPMEGTPQRVHFAWPVTLNVAFGADGRNLDSGYMLLFGTYDLPSRLFRAGRELATWSGRVDPGLRLQTSAWYNRVTRTWQHLRIQRRGRQVLVDVARHDNEADYLGLERAFTVDDPDPIDLGQLGLWTWGPNGMALARTVISFADSPGIRPLAPSADGTDAGDVAVQELRGAPGEPATFRRIANLGGGGTFSLDLNETPIDLAKTATLEFDCRLTPGLALSLLAGIRGQTVEFVLAGSDRYRVGTIPLGRVWPSADSAPGRWQHAKIDIQAALRQVFPDGSLLLDRIVIASPYESLEEIAGLGLNRAGTAYDLANVRWSLGTVASAAVPPLQTPVGAPAEGVRDVDDFERDLGDWARFGGWDGALLYRDPHEPASGKYSLRLLNPDMGGPAGAWITRRPYDLAAFPRLAFDYRMPAGVETNLLVRANGSDVEVRATGTDSSWPLIGRFADFAADGTWRHTEFDLFAALRAQLRTDTIRVESLAFADSRIMTTRQGAAWWVDNFRLIPAATGTAAPLPATAAAAPTVEDPAPPAAPYVAYLPSDRLCLNRFEWGESPEFPERQLGEFCVRREAWVQPCADDGATGTGCVTLVNLDPHGFFSAYFRKAAWDPERWPKIAFDCKFEQRGCALNLSLLVNEAMTIVEWTGANPPGNYFQSSVIGATDKARQDGQWQHVEFDLRDMILTRRLRDPQSRGRIRAAELATWATGHQPHGGAYQNPFPAQVKIDNFAIFSPHGRSPAFEWRVPGATRPPQGYACAFDTAPDTVPLEQVTTTAARAEFADVQPGVWFFHVRAQGANGAWGETTHCRIEIAP